MGRDRKQNRRNAESAATAGSKTSFPRSLLHSLTLIALGAVITFAIMTSLNDPVRRVATANPTGGFATPIQSAINSVSESGPRTVWQLLALPDEKLEKVDVIELNLAVAREIPGLENLDIAKYQRIVDGWANDIRRNLPAGEMVFHQTPEKWQNELRFFRLGQVAGYLDQEVGIVYIDEQKRVNEIRYTNPGDLFIHGLLDTKQGTCGNMPTLHVAIGRRLGWPVSLAAVESHTVCRFDDGQVVYNIEATDTGKGGLFAAGTDAEYIEKFRLPRKAVASGSDLHSMTARQMLGHFIGLRARHFADTGRMDFADRDYSLARALVPNSRKTWQAALDSAVRKGTELFDPGDPDGPTGLTYWLTANIAPRQAMNSVPMRDPFAEVERINAINRIRMQQLQTPGMPGQPAPGAPANPYTPTIPNHNTGQYPPPNPYGPTGSP